MRRLRFPFLPGSTDVAMSRLYALILLALFAVSWFGTLPRVGAAQQRPLTTFRSAREFLRAHTEVIELVQRDGRARVLVCPAYQGRVMTSTSADETGASYGWINTAFIEAGKQDKHFNNYGGEDRFWLAPEGGQFSLWFAPGAKQTFENWLTPPALNQGAFQVVEKRADYLRLSRRIHLINASRTKFDLEVIREIIMRSPEKLAAIFELAQGTPVDAAGASIVGFETRTTVINRGKAMRKATGLVSIWSLGMFPPGPRTEVTVPYRPGPEMGLGPVVKSDYFGSVPADRLTITPQALLFKADGKFRSKIGVSKFRARPALGSIDRQMGVLTLAHFSMPAEPYNHLYLNNGWDLPQKKPYVGDVANSYNDGPTEPGKPSLGGFYELETLSPAKELNTGDKLTHTHSTFHIQADSKTLERLLQTFLGERVWGIDAHDIPARPR